MIRTIPLCLAALSTAASAQQDEIWFDLDASRPRESLVMYRGQPTTLSMDPSVVDSGTHLVFAGSGGLDLASYTPPEGRWSTSAYLRLDQYGIESSWYIADFLATATWPDGAAQPTIQGFQFRTGGSGQYPLLPRNPGITDAEWVMVLDAFDHARQAKASACLLGLSQGTTDSVVTWVQSNSDRCVPRGQWVHVAAGWYEGRQRLYLDGIEVTDTLRQLGKGYTPRELSGYPLSVGKRAPKPPNQSQFFRGAIQKLQIRLGDLDPAKALEVYQQERKPVAGSCKAVPTILRPSVLDVASSDDLVVLRLDPGPSCVPGLEPDRQLGEGDSLDVMALSEDGSSVLGLVRVGTLSFPLSDLGLAPDQIQVVRLKARLVRKAPVVAGRVAAHEDEWAMIRPFILVGRSVSVDRAGSGKNFQLLGRDGLSAPGSEQVWAVSAQGGRVLLPIREVGSTWDLSKLGRGIWMVTDGRRSIRICRL
ncbi:MAG: hypothetical protein H6686_11275 [Fibrobacteria bacterium]|nr:hypothetical protein [Fibrobacteria bacterium]